MRMVNLIILILGLSGIECRYGIPKETSDREKKLETLAESAVLTLLSCFEKKVDTVGGIGITEENLVNILMTKQPLPVKLFRRIHLQPVQRGTADLTAPHKINLFVVETSNDQQFFEDLFIALTSQASAHLATFLIIDWPSKNNRTGCSEAVDYLEWTWSYHALTAFYVCVDELEERVLVYTFNPYTSKAPKPWIHNKTIIGARDHPWSLFVREYQPGNQEICNNLDFVKTNDLGGYPILSFYRAVKPFSELTLEDAEEVQSSDSVNIVILKQAMKAVNATLDIYLMGRIGNRFVAKNFMKKNIDSLSPSNADIFILFISSVTAEKIKTSIPVLNMDFVVMTHHTGEKTQLEKLIGVFDRTTRFGICLVIIGTVLFFKFFMGQAFGTATMNVIRIIGNTGLLRVPNENAPRLYLAAVFILVVTIIGVYQGLLAALLTKPTPLPEIDTLDDLANSLHKIHVPSLVFSQFFTDPEFNDRLAHLKGICEYNADGEFVINTLDACLQPRNNLIPMAIKYDLHISRERIVPAYAAYRIRENWALEERFNKILTSFAESRIFWHAYDSGLQRKMKIAEHKANLERDRPAVMKLGDLGFAFAFLGIGLSLATVVLVIEIAMKRRELGQR